MPPSADPAGTLKVVPNRPIEIRDVPRRIQVINGSLALVAKDFGSLTEKLPSGVYQIQVESTQEPFEQTIYLPPKNEITITYPMHAREVLPTGAAVPGGDAMHEYMRIPLDAVIAASAVSTKPARVVVMFTQTEAVPTPMDLAGFRLLDKAGRQITPEVKEAGAAGDTSPPHAWMILSRDIRPGACVLEWPAPEFGKDAVVRQALWCGRFWTTVVFVGINPETKKPDRENVSIYYWHTGQSFAPEQDSTLRNQPNTQSVLSSQRYTELALHSLLDGRSLLSMEEVDTNMLVWKSRNPMLGILGCHLLLQQPEKKAGLVRTVLHNLRRLVPGHPDLSALALLARRADIKVKGSAARPVTCPPMLRSDYVAMRDEDWQRPGLLKPGSLSDRTRSSILSSGVWTCWVGNKDGAEFVASPAKTRPAAKAKAAPAATPPPAPKSPWRALANLSGAAVSTSKNILSYAKKFHAFGGGKLTADHLRWTGMSKQQINGVLRFIKPLPGKQKKSTPSPSPTSAPKPAAATSVHGAKSTREQKRRSKPATAQWRPKSQARPGPRGAAPHSRRSSSRPSPKSAPVRGRSA